jgi:hypothetical protein
MKNYFLDGLKISNKMFFISLPSGPIARDLSSIEFKKKIIDTYLNDFSILTKLETNFFEEESNNNEILKNFGFFKLKIYLEELLNKKYKEKLIPVINYLEQIYIKKEKIKQKIQKDVEDSKNEDIEKTVTHLINEYINLTHLCLKGTTKFDPSKNGFSLEEEREKSGCAKWPNFDLDIKIRNSQYKLYGGAQLERLLTEFEIIAHSQEFPITSDDEVAVTIGLNSLNTIPDYDRGFFFYKLNFFLIKIKFFF